MQSLIKKIKDLPFFMRRYEQQQIELSAFYQSNRKEVLSLYRFFLKQIPNLTQRALHRNAYQRDIKYFFKYYKFSNNVEEIKNNMKNARLLKQQMQRGDYQRIGTFIPARNGQHTYLKNFLSNWERIYGQTKFY